MITDKITKIVLDSIKKVQEKSENEYIKIKLDSIPRDTLIGFDSLREVEATIIIQIALKQDLNKDIIFNKNIFCSSTNEAIQIKQIVQTVSKEIN